MDKGIDRRNGILNCSGGFAALFADGGNWRSGWREIGDRALPSFRADLFLDDVKVRRLIFEFMRFEIGYWTRVIILTRGFTFL